MLGNTWDGQAYDGSNAVFKDCHGGTIYCLAVYDAAHDKLDPVSSPFSVGKENGKMEFYEAREEIEDVVLLSKFGMLRGVLFGTDGQWSWGV